MTVPVQAATQIAAEAGAQAGGYKEAILFLVTAGVVVPLFHRLRVSPVLGFIGAGACSGRSASAASPRTIPGSVPSPSAAAPRSRISPNSASSS